MSVCPQQSISAAHPGIKHNCCAAEDSSAWPQGCLGYSINLVRPQSSGDRTAVLKHVLGGLLVFETKALALEYREHVTQVSSQLVSLHDLHLNIQIVCL